MICLHDLSANSLREYLQEISFIMSHFLDTGSILGIQKKLKKISDPFCNNTKIIF